MKFTQYFLETRKRLDRKIILDEWILRAIYIPIKKEIQNDGRVRYWVSIPEMENRILRVICLEDGETVHTAFFDRRYKQD